MALTVRKLTASDDRAHFRSGNVDLDRFFALYAGQNQFRHHIGTTYVAVDDRDRIVGYATVDASEINRGLIGTAKSKRRPAYPLPVLRLARLAVCEASKGRGVGRELLRAVFALAARMADDVGCVGVVVDAKPDATTFYAGLGFMPLEVVAGELGDRPQPVPLFLELAAFASPH